MEASWPEPSESTWRRGSLGSYSWNPKDQWLPDVEQRGTHRFVDESLHVLELVDTIAKQVSLDGYCLWITSARSLDPICQVLVSRNPCSRAYIPDVVSPVERFWSDQPRIHDLATATSNSASRRPAKHRAYTHHNPKTSTSPCGMLTPCFAENALNDPCRPRTNICCAIATLLVFFSQLTATAPATAPATTEYHRRVRLRTQTWCACALIERRAWRGGRRRVCTSSSTSSSWKGESCVTGAWRPW